MFLPRVSVLFPERALHYVGFLSRHVASAALLVSVTFFFACYPWIIQVLCNPVRFPPGCFRNSLSSHGSTSAPKKSAEMICGIISIIEQLLKQSAFVSVYTLTRRRMSDTCLLTHCRSVDYTCANRFDSPLN